MARDPADFAQVRAKHMADLREVINEAPDVEAVMRRGGPILDKIVAGSKAEPRSVFDDAMREIGALDRLQLCQYREQLAVALLKAHERFAAEKELLWRKQWLVEMREHYLDNLSIIKSGE